MLIKTRAELDPTGSDLLFPKSSILSTPPTLSKHALAQYQNENLILIMDVGIASSLSSENEILTTMCGSLSYAAPGQSIQVL
jgi:serine/threonine protein kinase